MPLFSISTDTLSRVEQTSVSTERVLQRLIENNLATVFGCRFVASEFSTGVKHGGRIDTLALSEDDNPVIIEYKKVESSELVNQSLFYLEWLHDHRGDFELAVQKALGSKTVIDWTGNRVICLAPSYSKYALHAVQVMEASIELWTYRLFGNSTLFIEEVLQRSYAPGAEVEALPRRVSVAPTGREAALTKQQGSYSIDQHLNKKPSHIRELALAVEEFVMALDPAMEEAPKKFYVAYRMAKNIACMEVQRQKVLLFLKLDPKKVPGPPGLSRDVSHIGHFGTGDLELALKSMSDLDLAKPLIQAAYHAVGG